MSIIKVQKWFLTTAKYSYLSFTSSWNRTRSCSTLGSRSSVRRWSLNRETGQQQRSTRSSYPRIFPFSGQRMKGLGEEERLALLNRLAIISSKRRKSPFFAGKRVAPLEGGVLSKRSFNESFTLFHANQNNHSEPWLHSGHLKEWEVAK